MQQNIPSSFTRETPAEEIAAGIDLNGKLIVITGASVGLGFETARVLAKSGADLVLGATRADKLSAAASELSKFGTKIHAHQVDLMDVQSVDRFADAVLALGRPVDRLIANAGIMAAPLRRTGSGVESQFMTNVVGHAVLLSRLADALAASDDGRFISLSSTAHHMSPVDFDDIQFNNRPYDPWISYGQSKTGNVLLAVKAAETLGKRGVAALALHPGMIQTELTRHLPVTDIVESTRQSAGDQADAFIALFKDVPRGAATTVWAATDPAFKGVGPLYLEDAKVADLVDTPNRTHGVLGYALDSASANRLWQEIERIAGRPLPL